MPLQDWNLQATFDGAYRSLDPEGHAQGEAPVVLHYNRKALAGAAASRWERLASRYAWPTSTRFALIGCGFGWGIEALQALGYTEVWGVDGSTWVQGAKDDVDPHDGLPRSQVPGRVRADDVNSGQGRGRLVRETVGNGEGFDVVVTELVLSALTDSEAVSLDDAMRKVLPSGGGTILHIIQPRLPQHDPNDPDWNWKTVAEWQALLPGAEWADGTGRAL